MNLKLIITTTDSKQNAQDISEALIQSKFSPCVQILPNIISIYRWEEKIKKGNEYLLLAKTLEKHLDSCKIIIIKQHKYKVPEIIEIDANILNKEYSDWFQDYSIE